MKKKERKLLRKAIDKFHSTPKPFKVERLSLLTTHKDCGLPKGVDWLWIIVELRKHIEMHGYLLAYHDERYDEKERHSDINAVMLKSYYFSFMQTYWVVHKQGLDTTKVVDGDVLWLT